MEQFILASNSPRRKELLQKVVKEYEVISSDIEEEGICATTPALLAQTLAQMKAEDIAAKHPNAVVIGCDTVVEVNGIPLGKPHNKEEAYEMLQQLSGRTHAVHTGVCVQKEVERTCFVETSNVFFATMSDEEIKAYVATDEPYDKAGGYAIQGEAAKFITKIEGCYFNIMGLPVAHLYKVLKDLKYL